MSSARAFALDDQVWFAAASGDFNPFHIDPASARRSTSGVPAVHGVHLLLWALNEAVRGRVDRVSASFDAPVRVGEDVSLEVGDATVRILAGPRPAATMRYVLGGGSPRDSGRTATDNFATAQPRELSWADLANLRESADAPLASRNLVERYPHAAASLGGDGFAGLVAITRVVGMRCPGLHSLLVGLDVSFNDAREDPVRTLDYEVTRADQRFSLVTMSVKASGMAGTVRAFVRPPPVQQRSMAELRSLVRANEFRGHKVLVVGGSRGLGEAAVKVLALGGADVTFTYARGQSDARRVGDEVRALGGRAAARHLDVTEPGAVAAALGDLDGLSAVLYCAVAPIRFGRPALFDVAEFNRHAAVAVGGAAQVATFLSARALPMAPFIYPSSVILDSPQDGAPEYRAAKAAGEALWSSLAAGHPNLQFVAIRLPRMLTDQTATTLQSVRASDASDIALQSLRGLRWPQPAAARQQA